MKIKPMPWSKCHNISSFVRKFAPSFYDGWWKIHCSMRVPKLIKIERNFTILLKEQKWPIFCFIVHIYAYSACSVKCKARWSHIRSRYICCIEECKTWVTSTLTLKLCKCLYPNGVQCGRRKIRRAQIFCLRSDFEKNVGMRNEIILKLQVDRKLFPSKIWLEQEKRRKKERIENLQFTRSRHN